MTQETQLALVPVDSEADFDLALMCGASLKWSHKAGPDGERVSTLAVSMSDTDFKAFVAKVRESVAPAPAPAPSLHPVFQGIVDQFIAPKMTLAGNHSYEWNGGLSVPLKCELEHDAAERGSRENGTGLQLEPDYAESMTLLTAEVNGVDIYSLLDTKQIEAIEDKALKDWKESDY